LYYESQLKKKKNVLYVDNRTMINWKSWNTLSENFRAMSEHSLFETYIHVLNNIGTLYTDILLKKLAFYRLESTIISCIVNQKHYSSLFSEWIFVRVITMRPPPHTHTHQKDQSQHLQYSNNKIDEHDIFMLLFGGVLWVLFSFLRQLLTFLLISVK